MVKKKNLLYEHPSEIFNDPVKRRTFEKNIIKYGKYAVWKNKFDSAMMTYIQEVESYLNRYQQQMIQPNLQFISPQILQEYYTKCNIMSNFFSFTENFFLDTQKNICCTNSTGNLLCFNENNYIEIFNKISLIPPPLIVIKSLRDIITLRKEAGDLWTYQKFKNRTNGRWSLYDEIDFFCLFDDNLAIRETSDTIILLHKRNYRGLVKAYNYIHMDNQLNPNLKEFCAISRMLKDIIPDRYPKNILACQKRPKQILMNKIIAHLQKTNKQWVSKITVNENYHKENFLESIVGNNDNSVHIRKFLNKYIDEAPANILEVIAVLANGDIDTINQLARMIATINLEKKFNPKMFGVIASNQYAFYKFIYRFYDTPDEIDYAFPTNMKSTSYFISAAQLNYAALMITFIKLKSSTLDLDEEYFKTLKKMIASKEIRKKDAGFGTITCINRSVCIALIETEKELVKYQEYMGNNIEVIKLGNIDTEELDKIQLNKDDYWWIHIIFATYGLMLLFKPQKNKKMIETYDRQRIVKQFIDSCCIVSPEADCYTEDFYQDFVRFFKVHFTIEPMKKGHFKNIVGIFCEITDTRPRHAMNENRRGLRGIAVDKNKLDDYLLNIETDKQKRNIHKGLEFLKTVNKNIVDLLLT